MRMSKPKRLRWRNRDGEAGYVLVTTTLAALVLFLFAGLAVDVSGWWTRRAAVQDAADAAALAAAPYMPVFNAATAAAQQNAVHNGFTDGANANCVKVTTFPVSGSNRRVKVCVQDDCLDKFFTSLINVHPKAKSCSIAEASSQVALGSPNNFIGTGSAAALDASQPATDRQGFWLAAAGNCSAKENGDEFLSAYDGNQGTNNGIIGTSTPTCTQSRSSVKRNAEFVLSQTEFKDRGYNYIVDVPCTSWDSTLKCTSTITAPVRVQIYDAGYWPKTDPNDTIDHVYANGGPVDWAAINLTTHYELWDPSATPEDRADDTLIVRKSFKACQTRVRATCEVSVSHLENGSDAAPITPVPDWHSLWTNLGEIPTGAHAGRYRVQVWTGVDDASTLEPNSFGSNSFALRAFFDSSGNGSGTFSRCSSMNPAQAVTCPAVSGDSSMSIYATSASSKAEFYLAKLSPSSTYRGKKVQILLWDPGEGGQYLQILPPGCATTACAARFKIRTFTTGVEGQEIDNGLPNLVGPTDRLYVNGKNTDPTLQLDATPGNTVPIAAPPFPVTPVSERYGNGRFNGRMVSLEFQMPSDYGCLPGATAGDPPDCTGEHVADQGWWRIHYDFGALPSVNDRSTWTVNIMGDPVHLVRGE